MPEIRCDFKKFGVITDNSTGILEINCLSDFCKTAPKQVVIHRWDLEKVNEDNTVRPIRTFRLKKPK